MSEHHTPEPQAMTEADKLAAVLRALLNEYGKSTGSLPIGSRKRELWLMARDMLDDRAPSSPTLKE